MRFHVAVLLALTSLIGAFEPVEAAAPKAKAKAAEPTFRAGFAEADITPELGMEQPGGYGKSFHRKLHDPCKVRAAVFDDGQKRVALVGVDALIVRNWFIEPARKEIEKKTGIPGAAVLIGASHSHSSGPVGMLRVGELDHASPLVRELAYDKSSCADAKYCDRVRDQIVAAVCQANANLISARCGVGSGREDSVAFNRRFFMKNGITHTHPGKSNPDIVKPAGPIDPQVGVIGAWDAKNPDKFLGCVVNYALHGTCGPGGISANWIYYMEQVIRSAMGPQTIVVLLKGACGDVTQVDNLDPHVNPGPEAWSRLVGGRIGAEALKVIFGMEPGALAPLDYRQKILQIKRRKPSAEHLAKSLELVKQTTPKVDATDWTFAKEILIADALIAKEPIAPVEVQAVQVGPAVFLTNPAEFFCQLGLDIKAQSPFPFTFPVELANDCIGYVPTEAAMGKGGGGYETRLTSYTNLEPTAGTQMVRGCVELARQLKPGAAPERPLAPPAKASWRYGDLPPQLD